MELLRRKVATTNLKICSFNANISQFSHNLFSPRDPTLPVSGKYARTQILIPLIRSVHANCFIQRFEDKKPKQAISKFDTIALLVANCLQN